jgi:3-hydroxyacyl-[acyl-carrier-protein] dehydratase
MSLTFSEITSLLKHRYPLLLIDGVTLVEPFTLCHAFKNLTYNEWFFPSHFPSEPILPGSLIIEAFTQAVAIPILFNNIIFKGIDIPLLLVAVDKVRYYKSVYPGDRLEIIVDNIQEVMGLITSNVSGYVGGVMISNCKITYKKNL